MDQRKLRRDLREVQVELQGQGASVLDHTICRCLSKSGLKETRPKDPTIESKSWNLPMCILTSHNVSERISFRQMRLNCRFVASHISYMFSDAKIMLSNGRIPKLPVGGGFVFLWGSSNAFDTVILNLWEQGTMKYTAKYHKALS